MILGTTMVLAGCGGAQRAPLPSCPDTASTAVARAWEAYQAQDYRTGVRAAEAALELCPVHVDALTVLGYGRLQRGELDDARRHFDAVLARDTTLVDALIGRGLVAWREADPGGAFRLFSRVVAAEPGNELALSYLARIPVGFGSVDRPPLTVPDTVVYPARAQAGRFEVRAPGTGTGWRPIHVNGMNLGAALPGRHPSQFPDSAVYAGWVAEMAAMNVNAVRVYTIHPPAFYDAVRAHNLAHPDDPLWLIHGVWTELPPGHDFRDPEWYGGFKAEMERVVDVLHGRADVPPRPGHAAGHYTADLSRWTLAYIIGREWEPFAVVEYNRMRADETSHDGTYLTARSATPTDVWMAEALEHLVAYEMDTYHAQRPVAYTNWPTLDPLRHPSETTVEEEVAIREALGERIERVPVEYDNDAASLDATLIQPTRRLPAGTFASYHAYPYYPDFMILEARYAAARSPWGPSRYFGYLTALREHHGEMPVLISEYGVPASRGSAHMQPEGWHHGGLTETAMAAIDARMTREIAAAGLAGGAVFAWIDEWFKKNWLVIEFELPADRNRLWLNRLDAEQHYGMLAVEPERRVAGGTAAERLAAWRDVPPLYDPAADRSAAGAGSSAAPLRAVADEAYLRLLIEGPGARPAATTLVGFDVVDPAAGELQWPRNVPVEAGVTRDGAGSTRSSSSGPAAPAPPVGLEFALIRDADGTRLVGHDAYVPWRIVEVGQELGGAPSPPPEIADPLPGFFTGRIEQRRNRPYQPVADDDGEYRGIPVVTNRRRYTRDSVEIAAYGYHRGILREGPEPDGDWTRLADDALEIRIPWGLLNVTDPSSRSVLYEEKRFLRGLPEVFGIVTVEGIRIVTATRTGGAGGGAGTDTSDGGGDRARWTALPTSGRAEDVALFAWPVWDEPRWRTRRRPVFDSLRAVFTELERQGGQ
ncbi:MAG: hypothetical protein R6U63_06535 [Longimicrobiales bacterium]